VTGTRHVGRRDIVIAAVFALALVLDAAFSSRAEGSAWIDVPLYGLAGASIVFRRRFPVPTLVVSLALALAGSLAGTGITHLDVSLLFIVLPIYAVAHETDGRLSLAGLAFLVGMVLLLTTLSEGHLNGDSAGFPVAVAIVSFLAGRMLRTRMLMTRALADEAARLELDRDLRAQAAVGEERARIAREMHDVVAHTMAIMVVQAGAARKVLDRDPEAAEHALGVVEDTGRVALAELRRLLGFLRDEAPAELAPQPSLDAVAGLVRRARETGLPVELRHEGLAGELPAGAELAVYRIIQEALTNTLKHAGPGARAVVDLRWSAGGLEVEVRDSGGTPRVSQPGGRHGIVGMRERVALYGGSLDAGPRPGGFAVRAHIPHAREAITA